MMQETDTSAIAVQMKTTFQNLKIMISPSLLIMIQQIIFFQALIEIMTKQQVLKSHIYYKGSSKMYLMELDAFMEYFHYRSNQIASHTSHP